MGQKKKEYKFKEASKVISKWMEEEKDYKSLDDLLTVWEKISSIYWDEGLSIDFALTHDGSYDFEINSNWQGQGMGGYPDAWSYDMSDYDEGAEDLSVQERALLVTAQIIAYEVNKDFSTDFYEYKEYSPYTKEFLEGKNCKDYSWFQKTSKTNPELLMNLIKEDEMPSYLMEYALINLGKNKEFDGVYEFLKSYIGHKKSRVRMGSYTGIFYHREFSASMIKLFEVLMEGESNHYNKGELKTKIWRMKRDLGIEGENNE